MEKHLKAEVARIAERADVSEKDLLGEVKAYTEKGYNEETAIMLVLSDHSFDMKSIKGKNFPYPTEIGVSEKANIQKDGENEEHDVLKIGGLFHGVVERGAEPIPFISTLSLWDEAVEKGEGMMLNTWTAFAGRVNSRRGTISLARGTEFVDAVDAPNVDDCVSILSESALPLTQLLERDDRGEYKYHKVDVLVAGIINRVPDPEKGDRLPIEIASLGSDSVTVWPPFEGDFPPLELGQRILLYGYHQVKAGESSISMKTVFPISG